MGFRCRLVGQKILMTLGYSRVRAVQSWADPIISEQVRVIDIDDIDDMPQIYKFTGVRDSYLAEHSLRRGSYLCLGRP